MEGTQAQLDEIEHGAVVDVEDGIKGLLELAVCIKDVGEIVVFLRKASIGYRNVNMADFDEDLRIYEKNLALLRFENFREKRRLEKKVLFPHSYLL